MKKYLYIFCISVFLATSLGMVQGVLAQGISPEEPPVIPGIGKAIPPGPQSGADLYNLALVGTNWLFLIFILTAVVFIIIAAFQFLTGGGNPQSVAEARQKLIFAVIAIAIAVLSRGIPLVVSYILTAP